MLTGPNDKLNPIICIKTKIVMIISLFLIVISTKKLRIKLQTIMDYPIIINVLLPNLLIKNPLMKVTTICKMPR